MSCNNATLFCHIKKAMRSCIRFLAMILATVSQLQSRAAQSLDADAGVEPPSHRLWLVAQSQSNEACTGKLVVATWYATGRETASGEPFNPNGHTAAHRSLQFGSRALAQRDSHAAQIGRGF